jgi:hypothetical protein
MASLWCERHALFALSCPHAWRRESLLTFAYTFRAWSRRSPASWNCPSPSAAADLARSLSPSAAVADMRHGDTSALLLPSPVETLRCIRTTLTLLHVSGEERNPGCRAAPPIKAFATSMSKATQISPTRTPLHLFLAIVPHDTHCNTEMICCNLNQFYFRVDVKTLKQLWATKCIFGCALCPSKSGLMNKHIVKHIV